MSERACMACIANHVAGGFLTCGTRRIEATLHWSLEAATLVPEPA